MRVTPISRRPLGACALFAVGLAAGLLVPRGPVGHDQAAAQDQRAGTSPEQRLRQLKLTLPPPSKSKNTLVQTVRVGNLLFVSGHGPTREDGTPWVGRLGQDLTVAQGRAAARRVGLHVLRSVRDELGSLDKVARLVKALGMVHATADFKEHPQVVNGFSDLMVEVFGAKAGKGARSAVGMASLPGGIPVEVEAVFEVRP
jgi:enamine deaminase RidA (YjgF/YER057c/UK114 family)